MRKELTILEEIDAYLSGELSTNERAVFEEKLSKNADLQDMVKQQEKFVRAVNRTALRAEISAVAGSSSIVSNGGLNNLFLGLGGLSVVAGIFGAYYYFSEPKLNQVNEGGELAQNELSTDFDTMTTSSDYDEDIYNDDAHTLTIEEPETIFSSVKKYDDQESEIERLSVDVHFQPRKDRERIKPNKDIVNVDDDKLTDSDDSKDKVISPSVEYKDRANRAHFPGGNVSMKRFMDKNLRYPRSASNKNIEAVVRCEFIVTADGLIQEINADCISMSDKGGEPYSDLKVLLNKRIMDSFIGNATHILRTMPTWEPARNSAGTPVLSMQRMYFNYSIDNGCLVYQLDDDITIEEDMNGGK